MKIKNIWFSDRERMHSSTKFNVYDDTGELEFGEGSVTFSGNDQEFSITPEEIQSISKTRPSFSWLLNLMWFVPVTIYSVISAGVVPMLFGVFMVALLEMWLINRDNFVEVVYEEGGKKNQAYFANASVFGYKKPTDIYEQFKGIVASGVIDQSLNSEVNSDGAIGVYSMKNRISRYQYIVGVPSLLFGAVLSPFVLAVPLGFYAGLTEAAVADLPVESIVLAVVAMWALALGFMVVNRLHDLDYSTWLGILFLVPIVNIFLVIILFFPKGSRKKNRFGNPPASDATFWGVLFGQNNKDIDS